MRKNEERQTARAGPRIKKGARIPIRKDRTAELVAAGFNAEVLKALVDSHRDASNERKPVLTNMKNRQLMSLVQRICRVASDIEAVNCEFSKSSGMSASEVRGARLPFELALYGTWLLFLSRTPLEHRASDRQLAELLLIACTRKFTGKSHYTALSELLMDGTGRDVSPEALIQLARDHHSQIKDMEEQLDDILAPLLKELSGPSNFSLPKTALRSSCPPPNGTR